MPESEIGFALALANPTVPAEPDDLIADPDAVPLAPPVVPIAPFGSIDINVPARSGTGGPQGRGGLAAGALRELDPVRARIALRAGALLGQCMTDPSVLAGVDPLSEQDRPETVEALRRPRWLLVTRLALLAGPAALTDPGLDQHDRARLVPWPLVIVLAAGAAQRSARADAQADDRRASAALRAIANCGLDPDASDSMGRSALLLACRRPDRPETVRALLELGAHPNHVDGRGRDASFYARHGGSVQVLAVVRNAQARAVLEPLRGPDRGPDLE